MTSTTITSPVVVTATSSGLRSCEALLWAASLKPCSSRPRLLSHKSTVLVSAPHDLVVSRSPSRTTPPAGRPATARTETPLGRMNGRVVPFSLSTHHPALPSSLAYSTVTSHVLAPAQATKGHRHCS